MIIFYHYFASIVDTNTRHIKKGFWMMLRVVLALSFVFTFVNMKISKQSCNFVYDPPPSGA